MQIHTLWISDQFKHASVLEIIPEYVEKDIIHNDSS